MVFVYGALMFLSLVGMMICSKKQKTNPAMQPVAFVLLVVIIVSGFFLMKDLGVFGTSNDSLMENETAFYASQGTKAGKFLAKSNAGKKALFLAEPGYEKNETVQKLIAAFKQAYGSEVAVATFDVPAKQGDSPMPLFMTIKAKDYDDIIAKNADAGVIVTTIGLPQDAAKMKLWKMAPAKRPVFFLMGLPSGPFKGLDTLVANGVVAGVIVSHPQAKYEVAAPSDPEKAFDIRYLLIDKSNVAANKTQLVM